MHRIRPRHAVVGGRRVPAIVHLCHALYILQTQLRAELADVERLERGARADGLRLRWRDRAMFTYPYFADPAGATALYENDSTRRINQLWQQVAGCIVAPNCSLKHEIITGLWLRCVAPSAH